MDIAMDFARVLYARMPDRLALLEYLAWSMRTHGRVWTTQQHLCQSVCMGRRMIQDALRELVRDRMVVQATAAATGTAKASNEAPQYALDVRGILDGAQLRLHAVLQRRRQQLEMQAAGARRFACDSCGQTYAANQLHLLPLQPGSRWYACCSCGQGAVRAAVSCNSDVISDEAADAAKQLLTAINMLPADSGALPPPLRRPEQAHKGLLAAGSGQPASNAETEADADADADEWEDV